MPQKHPNFMMLPAIERYQASKMIGSSSSSRFAFPQLTLECHDQGANPCIVLPLARSMHATLESLEGAEQQGLSERQA